ncbi:hypothetical protein P8825_14585 [Shouchella clausii]|nr:hypothetical protein [Shouchella clausii]MEB5480791.1 hypothetical protein [Shouchella clausii]
MRLKENIKDIYKTLLNDEHLLRLLHYKANHLDDDVLQITEERPALLSLPLDKLWEIRDKHIVPAAISTNLDKQEICRLLLYPGSRRGTRNHYTARQDVAIEVITHVTFSNDLRQEAICDRLADLLFDNRITGLGKVDSVAGDRINPNGLPTNFTGYRLIFSFGSSKGGS